MRIISIFICLFAMLASVVSANDFPGPTVPDINVAVEVVGMELATPVTNLPWAPGNLAADETDGEIVFPETFIRGDQYLAWSIDSETGTVELMNNQLAPGLTENAQAAVLLAPAWLRVALVDRFLSLDETDQEVFADLILNPEEERFSDEITFLVAMTGERDLSFTQSALLIKENVRLIYEIDEYLDYVEVLDYGEVGQDDYYSTVSYIVLEEGSPATYELPKEIYYWYIVHPKLDMEQVAFIDPLTGNKATAENGGVFWRDYLYYDAPGEAGYSPAYFMVYPEMITADELSGWDKSATSYFSARDIYNLDIVLHENGEPALVEFSYGTGTAVFSILEVEKAFLNEDSALLSNMLAYGPGDMPLGIDDKVVVVNDGAEKLDFATTIVNELTAQGYTDVSIVAVDDLVEYFDDDDDDDDNDDDDDDDDNDNDDDDVISQETVRKIIVPGHSPRAVYEAFTADSVFQGWLSGGYRVLEMHLNTEDDISDIIFIGGHQIAAPGSETDTVTLKGRPLFSEVLEKAEYVWDETVYGGMSGDRPFGDDGAMALSILGNWIGKNMLDNVAEYSDKLHDFSPERAIQPVRIAYNHFGNCGELQDLWTAAARTALIPAMNVSDINEDHVWNEFYHDGRWYYLQDDWSNGATRIATPGGAQDKDYGGGKTTSFIFRWDGNGEIVSVIDRYSETITLAFDLIDQADQPVPGAKIYLASEGYYGGGINLSFFVFTDENGHAEVELGDRRNYYVRIESGAGSWPDDVNTHYFEVVSFDGEADDPSNAGETYLLEKQLPEVMQGEAVIDNDGSEGPFGIHLNFNTSYRFQQLMHEFNAVIFTRFPENFGLDLFLVDEANYEKAILGDGSFDAAQIWTGITEFDQDIFLPDIDGTWYLVMSNKMNPESLMAMDVEAAGVDNPNYTGDADDDDEGGGGGDDDDDNENACECCG